MLSASAQGFTLKIAGGGYRFFAQAILISQPAMVIGLKYITMHKIGGDTTAPVDTEPVTTLAVSLDITDNETAEIVEKSRVPPYPHSY